MGRTGENVSINLYGDESVITNNEWTDVMIPLSKLLEDDNYTKYFTITVTERTITEVEFFISTYNFDTYKRVDGYLMNGEEQVTSGISKLGIYREVDDLFYQSYIVDDLAVDITGYFRFDLSEEEIESRIEKGNTHIAFKVIGRTGENVSVNLYGNESAIPNNEWTDVTISLEKLLEDDNYTKYFTITVTGRTITEVEFFISTYEFV